WALESQTTKGYWLVSAVGVTRNSIGTGVVYWLEVQDYDLETQRRIADYLDRETSQIDEMIEKLDDLDITLRERRTGVIDQHIGGSVDQGMTRLGRVAEAITGLTYSPADVVDHGGTVVHRSGSIQNSKIDRKSLLQVSTEIPDRLRM